MKNSQTFNIETKGRIVVNDSGKYTVNLLKPGARVEVLGAYSLKGKQSLQLEIFIIHKAPNTVADTFIRAVLEDQAQAQILGTIIVEKKAQNTNSFLRENVLLASKKATAHAVPNLEIHANEVKCSHAATIGTIDPEQIFYLQSRGLGVKTAQKLITDGFLKPIKERIGSGE